MIDFLVLMVKIGKITLEQVPERYFLGVEGLLNLAIEEENL